MSKHLIICSCVLFIVSACAPKNSAQASAPSLPQPSAPPLSVIKTLCGDTLVYNSGFTFKVDLATSAVTLLSSGEYGFDPYVDGWGTPIPACHYSVTKNNVPAITL